MSSTITIDHIVEVVRKLDGNECAVETAVDEGLIKLGLDTGDLRRFWDRVNWRTEHGETLVNAIVTDLDQLAASGRFAPAPVKPATRQGGAPMRLDEYQAQTKATAFYPGAGELMGVVYTALGLASEAGEVAGKVKKAIRDDLGQITPERREALIDELGDVLWYLARLASEIGADLAEVGARNVAKLNDRAERGAIGGDGDRR